MDLQEKDGADGKLKRHEEGNVARGNEQVLDLDYILSFVAVMEIITIKIMISLAAVGVCLPNMATS